MTPAVLFFFFLSMMDGCLSAPAEIKNQTDRITDAIPGPKLNLKPPVLHGDIAVPTTFTRNADPCAFNVCKWPKSGGYVQIPYYISPDFSEAERRIINLGILSFHQRTCIRFVPWSSGVRDFIYFFSEPNSRCWSYLGRQRGTQHISLEKNRCVYFSTVQHELLHALGFHHEQVRSDRDEYVWILYNNIQQDKHYLFEKQPTNNLGTPYDFGSVMHYNNYAFSSNGLPTILAKSNHNLAFGNASEMSENDIARVNKLYRCYGSSKRQSRMNPDVLY
ncbi:low choriolytic enzyme [Fundulus heteroclitus]|uniref:low choriolytic enzyme n=1 Tax=Fundulus heteroclitus TaxID=8078 RepID=UPI00165A6B00|nr:low choriolytic enzyme [Fundulus heteroclitus]